MDFSCVILAGSAGTRLHPLTCSSDDLELDRFDGMQADGNDNGNSCQAGDNAARSSADGAVKSDSGTSASCAASSGADCKGNTFYNPIPKCILPIAGATPLEYLLKALAHIGLHSEKMSSTILLVSSDIRESIVSFVKSSDDPLIKSLPLHHLPVTCAGSLEALSFLSTISPPPIPSHHHLMLLPADLVLEDPQTLIDLAQTHARSMAHPSPLPAPLLSPSLGSMTLLLSSTLALDADGVPIKESKKGKLGLLQREPDDIDIIALAGKDGEDRRLLMKKSKVRLR